MSIKWKKEDVIKAFQDAIKPPKLPSAPLPDLRQHLDMMKTVRKMPGAGETKRP